jgi:anti-anti-sigma factor
VTNTKEDKIQDAPQAVAQLVEHFTRNIDAYRSGRLKETEVRVQFIDPLFTTLGWDVANRAGYAEAYKDVIHEDAIKVGGVTKAPDYCFRIGGARKFFVEAKKPAVNIARDVSPAYQLRRYAWSAKLPLSILTDLEFIGCEGIDAILAGRALAGIEHGQIRLVGLNPEIRHILEITRLTEVFPIFDTVDSAVKA